MEENLYVEATNDEIMPLDSGDSPSRSGNVNNLTANLDNNSVGEKNVKEPIVGMRFSSAEDVRVFYEDYAKKVGFGMKRRTSKQGDDGELKFFTLTCTRTGQANSRAKNILKPRSSGKMGCKARVNATRRSDGSFVLSSVNLDHNHTLSSNKSHYFRCHKKITSHGKKKLELNGQARIRPCKTFKSMVTKAGGCEIMEFGEQDCQNPLKQARKLRLGEGDVEALNSYFVRMQSKDSGFFYCIDFDAENCIRNVFWADARSRATYDIFGDVVTFDMTYLTNKYTMPLASFVGVNHHGQSILFGCGLISNEDMETFVWVFSTWLKCMSGRTPPAIITDQDKDMQNAVSLVFPNTRHRYYLWHIMKKLPEKFGSHKEYKGIKSALYTCVYDSLTIDEFEANWQAMLLQFGLHDDPWLGCLYDERQHWIHVFVKETFWAGMSTTKHSEGTHAFFDGYVNSKTTLKQFIEQYDNALRAKVEKEKVADFTSFNSILPCISRFNFEKQFQQIYTINKFQEIQTEIQGLMYCHAILLTVQGVIITYMVEDSISINEGYTREVQFPVFFNKDECEVTCMCRLFEFRGILCRHVIKVITGPEKGVTLPAKYFLDRWRKDSKRSYNLIKTSYNNFDDDPESQRYVDLVGSFTKVASLASASEEITSLIQSKIQNWKEKLIRGDISSTGSKLCDIDQINNSSSKI